MFQHIESDNTVENSTFFRAIIQNSDWEAADLLLKGNSQLALSKHLSDSESMLYFTFKSMGILTDSLVTLTLLMRSRKNLHDMHMSLAWTISRIHLGAKFLEFFVSTLKEISGGEVTKNFQRSNSGFTRFLNTKSLLGVITSTVVGLYGAAAKYNIAIRQYESQTAIATSESDSELEATLKDLIREFAKIQAAIKTYETILLDLIVKLKEPVHFEVVFEFASSSISEHSSIESIQIWLDETKKQLARGNPLIQIALPIETENNSITDSITASAFEKLSLFLDRDYLNVHSDLVVPTGAINTALLLSAACHTNPTEFTEFNARQTLFHYILRQAPEIQFETDYGYEPITDSESLSHCILVYLLSRWRLLKWLLFDSECNLGLATHLLSRIKIEIPLSMRGAPRMSTSNFWHQSETPSSYDIIYSEFQRRYSHFVSCNSAPFHHDTLLKLLLKVTSGRGHRDVSDKLLGLFMLYLLKKCHVNVLSDDVRFDLHKWCKSHPELVDLDNINDNNCATNIVYNSFSASHYRQYICYFTDWLRLREHYIKSPESWRSNSNTRRKLW